MMKIWGEIKNEVYFDNSRLRKYQNNIQKYEFDRELRLLNLEILEKIELNFKKHLVTFFDKNWWIKNKKLYLSKYFEVISEFIENKEENFKNYDNDIKKDLLLNKNSFISIYLFIDKLTFWESLKIFRALNIKYKKNISKNYWINVYIFSSWIYWLKYLRNLCSHSENIFNRKMVYELEWIEIVDNFEVNNSYIAYFVVLSFFEKNILFTNLWQEKILKLLENNKISIAEISLNKKMAPPVSLKSEAWEALVNVLYRKMIKKSKVFPWKTKKINIILALDESNWLWKDWDLAWRIKEDMEYFKNISIWKWKNKNAVIMWRKTWDSIPEKYRPLPGRINCILSRKFDFEDNFWEIRKFSSLTSALEKLNLDNNIWDIYIIWWAEIYNLALKNKNLSKIYLTRIKWNFDCDVFVNFKSENFKLIENSEWKKNKKWIEFRFEVWKRK